MQPKVVQSFVPEDRVGEINPTTRRFSRTLEEAFPSETYPQLGKPRADEHLWQLAMAFCVGVLWGLLLGMWSRS